MNLHIDSSGDVKIVRVKDPKLSFPLLEAFSTEVTSLIEAGSLKLVINLSDVNYIDSASFGCLMDIYRMISAWGGEVKLVGLQERVSDMAHLTGVARFIEIFSDEKDAVRRFQRARR